MKIDVSEEERDLIVEALEHMFAYTRAASRDDARYQDLADALRATVIPEANQHVNPDLPSSDY
jgi:hypothetical protein